jgi:hypothetical protein
MNILCTFLLLIFAVQVVVIPVVALTPTVTKQLTPSTTISPTQAALDASASALLQTAVVGADETDVRELRDRLASKVAALRQIDVRVIAGEIVTVSDSSLQLQTVFGTTEDVELDPVLTKYYRITGAAKEEVDKNAIITGKYAIVNGPKSEGRVLANEVYLDEAFDSKAGRVAEVNTRDLQIKLETFDKENITIKASKNTSIQTMNPQTLGLSQTTVSGIKEGDTIHMVYRVRSIREKDTSVVPFRLLHIPNSFFVQ